MSPTGWSVRVELPVEEWSGWSKNRVWRKQRGRIVRGSEGALVRSRLGGAVGAELARQRVTPARSVLWVRIHVAKPNHLGDAINVVDQVADAIEDATRLDDRWTELRGVTWSIEPARPRVIVELGQDQPWDLVACSSCGQLLRPRAFRPSALAGDSLPHQACCRRCHSARTKQRRRDRARLVTEDDPPGDLPDGGTPAPWSR